MCFVLPFFCALPVLLTGCRTPVPPDTLGLDKAEQDEARALALFSEASVRATRPDAGEPAVRKDIASKLRQACELAPDNRDILQNLCNELEGQKRYADEQAALEAFLSRHPGDTEIRKAALRAAALASDAKAVLRHGEILTDALPDDADLFRAVVNLAIFDDLDDEAIGFIRRYEKRPALNAVARQCLAAWAAKLLGDAASGKDPNALAARARRFLEVSLSLLGDKAEPNARMATLTLIGMSRCVQGDFKGGLRQLRAAAELGDGAFTGFAFFAHAISKDPGALAKYRGRSDLAAHPLEAAIVEAAIAEEAGRIDDAIGALQKGFDAERAAGRFPPESFCAQLAQDLEEAGRFDSCAKLLKESIAAHPESSVLKNHLAYSLAVHNRELPLALRLVGEALRDQPDNSAYLDTLAWALFKDNRPCEALQVQLKAVEKDSDPELCEHLRDILLTLGRFAEARMIK
jgi:tetratricopeptide (TPR) repeat protein